MENFDELELAQPLRKALARMQFDTPTPIQALSIPHALAGGDVLGSAQTGTGKTGAFGIPLVNKLMNSPRGAALVLTPTRELATQVLKALKEMLSESRNIKTALLIGGDSMSKQMQQLRQRPRLIVATPGRIFDHLERGNLMLHEANYLVLDETDRMLDMGFQEQIDRILKYLPAKRQTMLFSATLPANIIKMADRYLTNPERVSAGEQSAPAQNLTQEVIKLSAGEKYSQLSKELKAREGSVIVFVKTKHGCDKMAERLRKEGHKAQAIHGDLRQNKRDRVIADFRNQKYRVMVATDIAARGLDIPHIEHVINYDLPQSPEDYIHRIGRTARAGAEGEAVCFITPNDAEQWGEIQRIMDPENAPPKPKGGGHKGRGRGRGKPSGGGNGGGRKPKVMSFGSVKPTGEKSEGGAKPPKRKPKRDGDSRRDDKPRSGGGKGRSDKPRSDRPKRDGDSRRDDKPRSGGGKGRSDKPRSDRPKRDGDSRRDDKPRSGGGKGRSDKPRSDRPKRDGDSRRDDKPRSAGGGKGRSDKPRGNRDGKPSGGSNRNDGARRNRRPSGGKPHSAKRS